MDYFEVYCEKQEGQKNILLDFYSDEELREWEKIYAKDFLSMSDKNDKRSILYIKQIKTN